MKEAIFPFNMFPEVDPVLGPEMRCTGEMLGLADSFAMAFYKSQVAAGFAPPLEGTALISVASGDRDRALPVAKEQADIWVQSFNYCKAPVCVRGNLAFRACRALS